MMRLRRRGSSGAAFQTPAHAALVLSSGFPNCGAIHSCLRGRLSPTGEGRTKLTRLSPRSRHGRAVCGRLAPAISLCGEPTQPPSPHSVLLRTRAGSLRIPARPPHEAFGGPSARLVARDPSRHIDRLRASCAHSFSDGTLQFVGVERPRRRVRHAHRAHARCFATVGDGYVAQTGLGKGLSAGLPHSTADVWGQRAVLRAESGVERANGGRDRGKWRQEWRLDNGVRGNPLKLIVVPLVYVPLTYAAHQLRWLPDEPLSLVLYMTPNPSSQTASRSCMRRRGALRPSSQLYVPQYSSRCSDRSAVSFGRQLIGEAPLVANSST